MLPDSLPGSEDRKKCVLVVEDEPIVRAAIAEFLRDLGLKVVEAGHGDEAWMFLETEQDVDAVFTDIQLPGSLDGQALAALIAERRPDVPVILTSGRVLPAADRRHAGFIRKPYDIEITAALIAEIANGKT